MRLSALTLCVILAAAPGARGDDPADAKAKPEAATQQEVTEEPPGEIAMDTSLYPQWDRGLRIGSKAAGAWITFGGKLMGDLGTIDADGLEDDLGFRLKSRNQWRRLRPALTGGIGEHFDFKVAVELSKSDKTLRDGFMVFPKLPVVGAIFVGQFDEPVGLENYISSRDITFMERGLPVLLERSWGVAALKTFLDDRSAAAVGLFHTSDDTFSGDEDSGRPCSFSARLTGLPWWNRDGERLFHIGSSYSYRRPEKDIRFAQSPEADFLPDLTDTGKIDADRINVFAAETAWVHGPLSVQGEYYGYLVDSTDLGSLYLDGLYMYGSYFLTGEHRPYDRRAAIFGRIEPLKPFPTKGWGAWEVAARYSYLNFDKSGLPASARRVQDVTLGVNWYLTPWLRIMANYIRSRVDGPAVADNADIFMTRFQLAF